MRILEPLPFFLYLSLGVDYIITGIFLRCFNKASDFPAADIFIKAFALKDAFLPRYRTIGFSLKI